MTMKMLWLKNSGWLLILFFTPLWSAKAVTTEQKLSQEQARHFLLRTGFAPTQAQLDQITGQTAEQVVTSALTQARASRASQTTPVNSMALTDPI